MSLFETIPLEASDELVEIFRNKRSIKEFSQTEFDSLVLRPLWGAFIKRSLETGRIPAIKWGLFQWDLYLGQELQNDLIEMYQKLRRVKAEWSNTDVPVAGNIVVSKEKIEMYFNEAYHIILANNLRSIRKEVLRNKGNNSDEDFEISWLDLGIMGFTGKLKDFDRTQSKDIMDFAFRSVWNCVQMAHSESRETSHYSPELRKVRDMVKEFRGMKWIESEEDDSVPDHSGLTTRQMLEVILGELSKTDANFLLKYWESYLYVLGIGKIGYVEITGQEKWEAPKDIEVFRKGLIANLKKMDNEQRIKYVSEVAFRADQMGYSVESLDAPVWEGEEECSLGDFIEAQEELSVSDRMNIEWFFEILRKEIYQEEWHKADLSFRDRIILGMLYENAFTIGELYALLEEYHGGYPAKYIDHWDQFGFYGKPEPGNRNHPHSLDEYWRQFFDDGVDPMKASSIAKILHLTEEGVVWMDVKIKDELNKYYKIVGKDYKIVGDEEEDVIFKFRYYKYKGVHSESHILKEHYVRTKYPNPKDD